MKSSCCIHYVAVNIHIYISGLSLQKKVEKKKILRHCVYFQNETGKNCKPLKYFFLELSTFVLVSLSKHILAHGKVYSIHTHYIHSVLVQDFVPGRAFSA